MPLSAKRRTISLTRSALPTSSVRWISSHTSRVLEKTFLDALLSALEPVGKGDLTQPPTGLAHGTGGTGMKGERPER